MDTERGSASKYADRFEFDVCELTDKTIEGYCKVIREAGQAGYATLVIDSLSHAWQELLEEVDQVAKAKYRGNTWSAWSDGTPKQRRLVDAILGYPGHVLATMRSKTEWQTGEGKNGKSQPVRVGLAPEQGKGIEYEFDLLVEIGTDHQAMVIKDRTGKFQDKIIDRPGEDFGRELAAWLADGTPAPVVPATPKPAPPAPRRDVPPEPSNYGDHPSRLPSQARPSQTEDRPRQSGPPRNGRALFAYLKEQEQQTGIALFRPINDFMKAQGMPSRIVDLDEAEVATVQAEVARLIAAEADADIETTEAGARG
jgi:hypothetical protein